MYQIHDYVVYGTDGVCQITDIIRKNFGVHADREYYVLNSFYGNSVEIYIPTDKNDLNMRPVMSKDEIYKLIKDMSEIDTEWIDDNKLRKAKFSEIIQSSNLKEIVWMIKTINDQKEILENDDKQLSNVDVEIMKSAEKQLFNEFALAFDIEPDQVLQFIMENINNKSSKKK